MTYLRPVDEIIAEWQSKLPVKCRDCRAVLRTVDQSWLDGWHLVDEEQVGVLGVPAGNYCLDCAIERGLVDLEFYVDDEWYDDDE